MSKNKERVVFITLVFVAALLIGLSALWSDVSATAKPDIIMTPSYTEYLTVYCTNGGSAAYFSTDESNGELYCLPHRP